LGTVTYFYIIGATFYFLSLLYLCIENPVFSPILAISSSSSLCTAQHAQVGENRLASLGHARTSDGEGHRVLSPLVEGGARRSLFPWLRSCNRKGLFAPIGFARRSCSSGHRLGGLQQAPESEQLAVPCQTAPKDAAEGIALYNEKEMSVAAPKYHFIMFFIRYP